MDNSHNTKGVIYNTCGCLAYDLNGELSLDYIEDNCLIYKYSYYSMTTKMECFNDTGKLEIIENLGESRNIRKKSKDIICHGVTWLWYKEVEIPT